MTIKNIFKTGLLALTLALTFTSCMNFDPKAQMGDNLVWNTSTNFQLFANQFYSWTRDFGGYSANYQNGLSDGVHSDYRSDILCSSSQNQYAMGANTTPVNDANFTTLYKRIYYCNLLLSKVGDRTDVDQPQGEALWFRAYLYFELVQIYGDCQLVLTPLDIDSGELKGTRNPRGEVIDQCIEDLYNAVGYLPDSPTEAGRLCKSAAWALMSRIALYEGTWQKFHTNGADTYQNTDRSYELLTIAKDAAERVMNTKKWSLFQSSSLQNSDISSINQSYRYMFILEDADCNPAKLQKTANTEYILAHRHRLDDKLSVSLTQAYLAGGSGCFVTRKMANMYLCTDGLPISLSKKFQGYAGAKSEFNDRDPRMDNELLWNGESYWDNDSYPRTSWTNTDLSSCRTADSRSNSGYLNQKWGTERSVPDYYESYDYPVIRYAEVLLNYAEASFELTDGKTDITADLDISINLLRSRAGFAKEAYLTKTLVDDNGLDMREEIRRERTVELYLEGFRIDDLKRWNTAQKEMTEDQLGVKITGTWYETNWSQQPRALNADGCIMMYQMSSLSKWSSRNDLYPIPTSQRELNPNLSQNTGW